MKYGLAALTFALFLLAPAATAQVYTSEELDTVKEKFNANQGEIPGYLKPLIGNQKMNIYIQEGNETNVTLKLSLKNIRIERMEKGEWEDPTLEVWVEREKLREIVTSESPFASLKASIKNDEIRYKEHGIFNNIRFFLVNLFL